MKLSVLALMCASLVISIPVQAGTVQYFGGFEDAIGGDYDYNDTVFSLQGALLNLTTIPGAAFYSQPVLNGAFGSYTQTGTPFWNNESSDGPEVNIGYCIYGGGNCGMTLDPTATYLAMSNTSNTGSANDVTFSVSGAVTVTVYGDITAGQDIIGWYNTSNPSTIYWINQSPNAVLGTFTFTPNGSFGLVGNNGVGQNFYSDTSVAGNTADDVSHFAFFDPPSVPEPSTFLLMGAGLMLVVGAGRRRSTC